MGSGLPEWVERDFRRMCEVAAHLTDHVLPHVPARQWVLSVPKRLRPYLHHDVCVAGAVLQILLRAIRTTLRRTSPEAPPEAQVGAVSFFHRFGSSLNVHPHYHLVVLDGVFSRPPDRRIRREVRFHEASELTPDHWRKPPTHPAGEHHEEHLQGCAQHRRSRSKKQQPDHNTRI